MNILDAIALVKSLTAAIKAGDFKTILSAAAKLLELASEFFGPVKAGTVVTEISDADLEELDKAVFELRTAKLPVVVSVQSGQEQPAELDPATVLVIVQVIGQIISFIRERRKK